MARHVAGGLLAAMLCSLTPSSSASWWNDALSVHLKTIATEDLSASPSHGTAQASPASIAAKMIEKAKLNAAKIPSAAVEEDGSPVTTTASGRRSGKGWKTTSWTDGQPKADEPKDDAEPWESHFLVLPERKLLVCGIEGSGCEIFIACPTLHNPRRPSCICVVSTILTLPRQV